MHTIDEMKDFLTSKGYVNLRVENVRSNYILSDKDGKTFCYHFYMIEDMMKAERS